MPLRVLVPTLSSVPHSKASSGSGGESASSGQWPSALSKLVLIQYSNNKVSRQNQAALQSSVFAGRHRSATDTQTSSRHHQVNYLFFLITDYFF
jgi:hypothetical protein